MDQLRDRSEDIEYLLKEIKDLYAVVDRSNTLIEKLVDEELREVYIDEVKPFIEDHKRLVVTLRDCFKDHFIWERKVNYPRNLRYRRLYKEILKDFKEAQPVSS